MSGSSVLCAFWRESRFDCPAKVCSNLVGGVPACVVNKFYPAVDPFSSPAFERWLAGVRDNLVICKFFVRSDIYHPEIKCGCYFGDDACFHSDVKGFGACARCCRWERETKLSAT